MGVKSRRHIGHGQVLAGAAPTQGGTSCSFGDPESLCKSKKVLLTFCTNIRSLGTVLGTRTPAGAAFIIMVSGELGSAEVTPLCQGGERTWGQEVSEEWCHRRGAPGRWNARRLALLDAEGQTPMPHLMHSPLAKKRGRRKDWGGNSISKGRTLS